MRVERCLWLLGGGILAAACGSGASEITDDDFGPPASGGATASGTGTSTGTSMGGAGGMGTSSSSSASSSSASVGGASAAGGSAAGGSAAGGSGGGVTGGAPLWAQAFADDQLDIGRDVALASNGDIFVTGFFEGTISIGSSDLTALGEDDVFVARIDSTGAVDWVRSYGDAEVAGGYGIAVDGMDNVVLLGEFTGTLDFGNSTSITATSDGFNNQFDTFVAKLDGTTGDGMWARTFVMNAEEDSPSAVATDSNDEVVFVGEYLQTVDFGSGISLTALSDANGNYVQAYVTKLDGDDGTTTFARAFVGDAPQLPTSVATSGEAIVVVGGWEGVIELDESTNTQIDAGTGGDGFVVMLDEDGAYQWHERLDTGGTEAVLAHAVAVDSSGNVITAGSYSGSVDFGSGSKNAGAATDAFVVKLDSAGAHQWDAAYGDGSAQSAFALATDDQDDVVVAGNYRGLIDLGNGDLPNPDVNTLNVFVAKLAGTDGATQWSRGYGDAADQSIGACVSDADESYCIGTFDGSMTFGGETLNGLGANDVWLSQFAK